MKTHRISLTKQLHVCDLLKDNIKKLDNNFCEYRSPQGSDAVIAKIANCGVYPVARIRRELFGKLRESPRTGNKKELTVLTEQLKHLTEWAVTVGYAPPPNIIVD